MSDKRQKPATLTSVLSSPTSPVTGLPGLVWFYFLWIALASVSIWLGHSSIHRGGAFFLLGGIASTTFFFAAVARSEAQSRGLAELLATYQTIIGIAWSSAFFYFSEGAGDLVLGMYMTVLMFAMFHLNTTKVLKLGAAALGGYGLVVGIKILSAPTLVMPLADGIRLLVLIALVGWAYMIARQLRELRITLQYRNEELQTAVDRVTRIAEVDHLTKSFNRRHIMEVMAREKSRSDRSGIAFGILLFDLDHFKRVNDQY